MTSTRELRHLLLVLPVLACLVLGALPARAQCTDRDGDGYGRPGDPSCPAGEATDCNDGDPEIHPGAPEACNAFDDDCDGTLDNGCDRTCDSGKDTDRDSCVACDLGLAVCPGIAWADGYFGIVDRGRMAGGERNLFFERVDRYGQDASKPRWITDSIQDERQPRIAWTGTGFGVVWIADDRGPYFRRLDSEGNPLGDIVDLSGAAGDARDPSIAWSGAEFGIVWIADGSVMFGRVSSDGLRVGENVRVADGWCTSTTLAWRGPEYGVAWSDDGVIWFARVRENGALLGDPIRVSDGMEPDIVAAGDGYGMVWLQGDAVRFARLDQFGNQVGSVWDLERDRRHDSRPRVAWTGDTFAVAWVAWTQVGEGGHDDVYVRMVRANGEPEGSAVQVNEIEGVSCPDISWSGAEVGVVWWSQKKRRYFDRVRCCGDNRDGDSWEDCADCDPADDRIYPGAEEVCDGRNNNCDDPAWPATPADETDDDGDGYVECEPWEGDVPGVAGGGDCDDGDAAVYPGAEEVCDGQNNDCDDPVWPAAPADETDDDGDGYVECEPWEGDVPGVAGGGDCNDGNAAVYPGAEEVCDGQNNDCDDPAWPAVPPDEEDADGDDYSECQGDCDDTDPSISPAGTEVCNGIDDDCDGMVDDDELGEDTDGDGVHNVCDNCREMYNPHQEDLDQDGVGNPCDNCMRVANPGQENTDGDSRGDACDNCPETESENFDDTDGDGRGDVCDNCIDRKNESQHDLDGDGEGDECDLDDGVVLFEKVKQVRLRWQEDPAWGWYNLYRGSLAVLRAGGPWTQEPGSNPYAAHWCDLGETTFDDQWAPYPGEGYYWLVTGETASGEETLGDGAGVERSNDHPCP